MWLGSGQMKTGEWWWLWWWWGGGGRSRGGWTTWPWPRTIRCPPAPTWTGSPPPLPPSPAPPAPPVHHGAVRPRPHTRPFPAPTRPLPALTRPLPTLTRPLPALTRPLPALTRPRSRRAGQGRAQDRGARDRAARGTEARPPPPPVGPRSPGPDKVGGWGGLCHAARTRPRTDGGARFRGAGARAPRRARRLQSACGPRVETPCGGWRNTAVARG